MPCDGPNGILENYLSSGLNISPDVAVNLDSTVQLFKISFLEENFLVTQ